ncbi:MAG: ArsR/SmtB family transcription factor [Vicinamibacterales bacterium]
MDRASVVAAPLETPGAILAHMAALADAVRCRMLLVLERHELTVTELCAVIQLPQSTVSRHLKTLADDGWVASRRDGTSRYYRMALDEMDEGARRLWPLIREQVSGAPGAEQDARRLAGVLERRRTKSAEFFSSAAGQWDRLRSELFGHTFHLHALLALLDPTLVVGDLGCGTGETTSLVAPHVARVVAVDDSAEMLQAARQRLEGLAGVDLRRGNLTALPIGSAELDAALIVLVLHHVSDPARALAETARVLKPGGRVLLVDMLPHDRAEYQQQMGHVWLGFDERDLARLLGGGGFTDIAVRPLPVGPETKGPALFVATARKR